jgi:hypothetical protein
MNDGPTEKEPAENAGSRSRRVRTRTIAFWALAIAIGHVIYHALRDHVFPDAY